MIEAQDLLYVRTGVVYPGYAIQQRGRPIVRQNLTRKPFVAPKLNAEASLEGVTLLSSINPTRSNASSKDNLASRAPKGGRAA
jgi:hypothetical protein